MKSINLKFGVLEESSEVRIEAALKAANGGATAHTYTSAREILNIVVQAEKSVLTLLLKKNAIGAKYVAWSGETVANAYKYSRTGTRINLERRASGWFLNDVTSVTLYQKAPKSQMILSARQDEWAIKTLRNKYRFVEPVTAKCPEPVSADLRCQA